MFKGQRINTKIDKAEKQVHIYGQHGQLRSKIRSQNLAKAGKLWEDEDFQVCKMDVLCAELVESAANSSTENTTRIVRAWQERWEIGDVGANGNELLHARFVRKYGGLKWLDPDNGFSTRTAHPEMMYFEKKRGKNRYHILACKEGYDFGLNPHAGGHV